MMKILSSSARASSLMQSVCRQRAAVLLSVLPLILTMSCVVSVLAQSQPAVKPTASPSPASVEKRGPNENSPATGSIKGRVVGEDGRPIVNATLMAQAVTGQPSVKPAKVDAEGKFNFDELAPASYIVMAVAPGYIDEAMSTGDPSEWPRYLIGAQVKIRMIKGGVITGKVTNSKGEPIVGVPVHAVALNNPSFSATDFMTGGSGGESDDRGIYRIYGLKPGQYVVNAGGAGQFGFRGANGFDLDVPTYYPSANRDTAIPVVVRSGDETTGIDIKYFGTEGHRITGFVLGSIKDDLSAANAAIVITLSLAGTQSVLSMAIASPMDQRRAFGFNGMADGDYDLFAVFQTNQPNDGLVATKRVTVRGGDVSGVELNLAQLASIAGTIALDPIKPEDKCDQRDSQLIETVFKTRRDEPKKSGSQMMTTMLAGFGTTLNAKGEFMTRNLEAGRYRFEIKLPTDAWYVRTINLSASAAVTTQQPSQVGPSSARAKPNQTYPWQGFANIKPGQQVSGVSIFVGQDAAGLRGRVAVTPEGAAAPADLHVHLVPADREQSNDVLRYSDVMVMSDGSFAFSNVAPGRYFILSRIEPRIEIEGTSPRPAAWDPTTRAKLRQEAEAAKVIVDLKPCQRLKDYALPLRTEQ